MPSSSSSIDDDCMVIDGPDCEVHEYMYIVFLRVELCLICLYLITIANNFVDLMTFLSLRSQLLTFADRRGSLLHRRRGP